MKGFYKFFKLIQYFFYILLQWLVSECIFQRGLKENSPWEEDHNYVRNKSGRWPAFYARKKREGNHWRHMTACNLQKQFFQMLRFLSPYFKHICHTWIWNKYLKSNLQSWETLSVMHLNIFKRTFEEDHSWHGTWVLFLLRSCWSEEK